MEPSNLLVVCLGMGTVFFGLICLIAICKLTSFVCMMFEKNTKKTDIAKAEAIQNKQEILAAVCAVIAEETGTDAKNIRVLSFKRI
ncbi:MAG TPA: hypothetical protein DCO93_01430 [Clostridiales bacterium]|nr:hypothetical protein [Clostridiales bacterium]